MNLKFLSLGAVDHLVQGIGTNKRIYIAGKASSLVDGLPPGAVLESRIAVDSPPALCLPQADNLCDAENARMLYTWLSRITPVQASDHRLWTYLSHSTYADYVASRWPIDPESEVAERIRERYFVQGSGLASMSRNALARLWWAAFLTYDEARTDHYELTDVLLSLQDIQVAFLERALGRSRTVLRAALQLWKDRAASSAPIKAQTRAIQVWAKLIRLHGAITLLDALPPDRLKNLLWVKLASALGDDWSSLPEDLQDSPP